VTGILNLTGRLLKGALVGGLVAMSCGFGLLTLLGVLSYGIGGLLMGLYFGALPIYYAAPVGILAGAVVSLIRMVRQGDERIGAVGGVWAGVLLIGLAVLAVIPHLVIGEERMITHGATWAIEAEGEHECAVSVVRLYLLEYAQYENVCSAALLEMLETTTSDVVPITYRVTYDFGDVRGYSLRQVGDVEMAPREWLGGGSACGREPFPACDSAEAQKGDRMLYESSWVE
jgi:hypothetical protein